MSLRLRGEPQKMVAIPDDDSNEGSQTGRGHANAGFHSDEKVELAARALAVMEMESEREMGLVNSAGGILGEFLKEFGNDLTQEMALALISDTRLLAGGDIQPPDIDDRATQLWLSVEKEDTTEVQEILSLVWVSGGVLIIAMAGGTCFKVPTHTTRLVRRDYKIAIEFKLDDDLAFLVGSSTEIELLWSRLYAQSQPILLEERTLLMHQRVFKNPNSGSNNQRGRREWESVTDAQLGLMSPERRAAKMKEERDYFIATYVNDMERKSGTIDHNLKEIFNALGNDRARGGGGLTQSEIQELVGQSPIHSILDRALGLGIVFKGGKKFKLA